MAPNALFTLGRRCRRSIGFWAGLLLAAGCARDALIEAPEGGAEGYLLERESHPRGVIPAETLHADIELFGLSLAKLESSHCPATPEQPAIVQTRVEPAALVRAIRRTSGDARTELATDTGAAAASDYNMRDGDLFRHYRIEHRSGSFAYSYDNGGALSRRGRDAVPEGAPPHDLHSAMMLLRSWRPRLNDTAYFYVVLGRRLWRVEVSAAGPEVIKTNGVPQLTHRIDGVGVRLWQPSEAAPRRFSVWLSEGAERVPLRMVADASFGQVTMTLTERDLQGTRCERLAPREATVEGDDEPTAIGEAWHGSRTSVGKSAPVH